MRLLPPTAAVVLALSVSVHPVTAQSSRAPAPTPPTASARDSAIDIPESMMPPAGKCRIWMLNVPAKQQPAATDCTTALRQKPANAVLVFGAAVRDFSPFEVRQLWTPRRAERDTRAGTEDEVTARRAASDPRDSTSDQQDSTPDVMAQRVEQRNAALRQAEPLGTGPAKPDVKKPGVRTPPRRTSAKPAPKKPEKP